MTFKVGQRIRNKTELAHLYEGTGWEAKLARPRRGTVINVPWALLNVGEGTMLVEWDSLTGKKSSPEDWTMWIYSTHVETVA